MVRCITCNVFHMRKFCRFFYCLAWSETVEFNRLPCPNNVMYGDTVFANRFRYLIAYLWNACIDMTISTPSCTYCIYNRYWQNHRSILRNFLCALDLLRLNSIVCHDQTTRNTMMQFSLVDSAIIRLCLECVYWYGYLDSLILILRMK